MGVRDTSTTAVPDAALIGAMTDPVRPASEMGFTGEQLSWLADIARPRCCHVTGEHSPTHFREKRFVCGFQMADVAYRLRDALGLDYTVDAYGRRRVDPNEPRPSLGCPICEREATGAAS